MFQVTWALDSYSPHSVKFQINNILSIMTPQYLNLVVMLTFPVLDKHFHQKIKSFLTIKLVLEIDMFITLMLFFLSQQNLNWQNNFIQ